MKLKSFSKIICLILSIMMISTSVVFVGAIDSTESDGKKQSITMTEYDPATGKSEIKEYKIDSAIIEALKASEEAQHNQPILNPRANVLGDIDEFTKIGLTKVENTKINPYSAVGFFKITTTAGIVDGYGTAFMISDNVAVTAAHNLYNKDDKKWKTGGYFYPGRYGYSLSKQPFGATYAEKWAVCTQYIEDPNRKIDCYYDWGVILLKENIGKKCGKLNLSVLSYDEIRNSKLTTIGYPQAKEYDINLATVINYSQYQQITEPQIIMDKFFTSSIDCKTGQSGSPVFVNGSVCGILAHRPDVDGGGSTYTRIDENAYSLIMQYVSDNK